MLASCIYDNTSLASLCFNEIALITFIFQLNDIEFMDIERNVMDVMHVQLQLIDMSLMLNKEKRLVDAQSNCIDVY